MDTLAPKVYARTDAVLDDVRTEADRQLEKWGEQRHPDGTDTSGDAWRALKAKHLTDYLAETNKVTWRAILEEDVAEALAEADPAKLREELVQVAAVAVSWVRDIDARNTEAEADTDKTIIVYESISGLYMAVLYCRICKTAILGLSAGTTIHTMQAVAQEHRCS